MKSLKAKKKFPSTEVGWFSPGLVFRLYSQFLILMLSTTGQSLYTKCISVARKFFKNMNICEVSEFDKFSQEKMGKKGQMIKGYILTFL